MLVRYFWVFVLRVRLFYLHTFVMKEKDKPSVEQLLNYLHLMDDRLLQDYHFTKGKAIEIYAGHRNVNALDSWLVLLNTTVKQRVMVGDGLRGMVLYRRVMLLDEFLMTAEGRSVKPISVKYLLQERMENHQRMMSAEMPADLRSYYDRVYSELFRDLFAIVEGLLKAAMMNVDKTE